MTYELTEKQRATVTQGLTNLAIEYDNRARQAYERGRYSWAIYCGKRRQEIESLRREVFGVAALVPYQGKLQRSLDAEAGIAHDAPLFEAQHQENLRKLAAHAEAAWPT